jgi:excisionase family DNA binding protein
MSTLLTINEVAERLKVKPLTVRRWMLKKAIAFINLPGGGKRIKEENLEGWIEKRTVKAKI